MYVSDLDQSEIPAGKVYQLSIRHPDGATQQLDISAKNYHALKLQKHGQDPEEAWPQAWVHHQGHQGHQGGQHPTYAPSAPEHQAASHRLTANSSMARIGY